MVRSLVFYLLLFASFGSQKALSEANLHTIEKSILDKLREASLEDTTSLRREFKLVIDQSTYHLLAQQLEQGVTLSEDTKVKFQLRDNIVENGKNATFTFYGSSLTFPNGNVKTSIKLRSRFYLQVMNDGSINIAPFIKNSSFLEIKINNATENLKNVVNKYRLQIYNEDLIQLFSLDPKGLEFLPKLRIIEEKVSRHPANRNLKNLISIFFNAINIFAQLNEKFITPEVGIYYERVAYQVIEDPYLMRDDVEVQNLGRMDYQITVDKNVRGYFEMPNFNEPSFTFIDFFRKDLANGTYTEYPLNTYVVETKIPLKISQLDEKFRSKTHNYVYSEFIQKLEDEFKNSDIFKVNKGKASYLRKRHAMAH